MWPERQVRHSQTPSSEQLGVCSRSVLPPSPHSALNFPWTSEEVICFPLSSPSTEWGLEGLPTLLPLPPRLPLPVQPMGVGVWLSPGTRIISSVMYIQTHALLLGRTRQGEGACAAGRRGVSNQVIEPEPEPSRNGGVNGS